MHHPATPGPKIRELPDDSKGRKLFDELSDKPPATSGGATLAIKDAEAAPTGETQKDKEKENEKENDTNNEQPRKSPAMAIMERIAKARCGQQQDRKKVTRVLQE